jgi:hypothetical protein
MENFIKYVRWYIKVYLYIWYPATLSLDFGHTCTCLEFVSVCRSGSVALRQISCDDLTHKQNWWLCTESWKSDHKLPDRSSLLQLSRCVQQSTSRSVTFSFQHPVSSFSGATVGQASAHFSLPSSGKDKIGCSWTPLYTVCHQEQFCFLPLFMRFFVFFILIPTNCPDDG